MEIEKRYFICYELGIHHTTIETNQKDFFEVINDLSNEFTIYKVKDNSNPCIEVYNIQNYYGDMQNVGFVLTYLDTIEITATPKNTFQALKYKA